MLTIKNLSVAVQGKQILNGLNLDLPDGQIHAIMGPNGSGKSTLSNILAGRPGYEVLSGEVTFNGQDVLALSPEARAVAGIFLAFQYPVEIPGVNNLYFLKAAVNSLHKQRGEPEVDAYDFMALVNAKLPVVGLNESFLSRALNAGFSGGEKKRNELLQMLLLEPKLAILDETDSGLDIDALKMIANSVESLRDEQKSFLMITHYQRLLDYVKPEVVHILYRGQVVQSGGLELAEKLEKEGYAWLDK